ncbi:MAG: hypothetical protein Q9190_006421 [Brigantiaea leucoxantha]
MARFLGYFDILALAALTAQGAALGLKPISLPGFSAGISVGAQDAAPNPSSLDVLGLSNGGVGAQATASASALGTYNIDCESVSVSGLSAGGFMAAQLGIAYSDVFKTGFGVFAGGPFDCARSQPYFSCMFNGHPSVAQSVDNMKAWSGKQIAPVSNLAARKIYMQVGSADSTVGPNVMAQLKAQLANFDDSANTTFVTTSGASHTFPTDFDGAGDSTCGISLSPYISNCKYDGAGAVLKWLYGSLNPRNAGTATGTTVSYAQTGSYGAQGLGTTGYLYVPESCTGNSSTVCKLHVAMHGCLQSYGQIGSKFITNTGYTMWADTNDIIVLFPQAVVDYTMHTIWSGLQIPNPNGCFDWVGWYGTNADQIGGRLTLMSLAGYD